DHAASYAEAVASTFTLEACSSRAAEQLFDLSLSIDAHLGSMSDSGERAVGGVTSGQIALGEEVTWRAVLGRPAEALLLVPYLRRLIRTRNDYLVAALDDRS